MKQLIDKNLYDEKGRLNHRKIPLLSYLTDDEFNRMSSNFEVKEYNKGDHIFNTGDPASKMYIIYSGFMKITINLSDGREQLLYLYHPGDFVGGLNLLSGDTYVYNGIALKQCTVITIFKQDFNDILLNNNKFALSLLNKSYERIRRSEALIDRLSVINADLKMAKSLINLVKSYGKQTDDGMLLDLTITQEELGSYSGMTRETASRKLKQFEEDGLIEQKGRGKILIKDIKGLMDLVV